MKFINLTNIKQKQTKSGIIYYYWKESIGAEIPFEYNENKGTFILKKVSNTNDATLLLEDKEYITNVRYIKDCKLDSIFPTINWLYTIGQQIKDNKRDIVITNTKFQKSETIRRNKYYTYKCNICGFDSEKYDYWINETGLIKNIGCACCSNSFVVKGINDIATTDSWMIPYFYNVEDVYKYTKGSNHKIIGICPNCNHTKETTIQRIYHRTFSCDICSRTGGSMGERFFANLLQISDIKYICQLTNQKYSWVSSYRYDFYLPDYNWIIEIHGNQHYEESKFNTRTLLEEQTNDLNKQKLAEQYVDKYIIIPYLNCDIEKFIQEIKRSSINTLIKWNEINIEDIQKRIDKSIMAEICEYYNSCEIKPTTMTIGNKYGVIQSTVHRYLVRGTKAGLCNYNGKEQAIFYRHYRSNPICIEQNGITHVFALRSDINQLHMSKKMIGKYCDTGKVSRDGYYMYSITKKEFNDKVDEALNNPNIIIHGEKFPAPLLDEA